MNKNQSADLDGLLRRGLAERAKGGSGELLTEILQVAAATPQREVWRWPAARRSLPLVAAGALAIVALGIFLVWRGFMPSVGHESPMPTPSETPASQRPVSYDDLVAGSTYRASRFSEPFDFVVPGFWVAAASQPGPTDGVLRIAMGCCWETWFLDDQPVNADVCNVDAGTLPDLPATPDLVGEWLRSSLGIVVSDQVEIAVDGRTALRFDLQAGDDCHVGTGSLGAAAPHAYYQLGTRMYAIPTGDDTILYVIWSDPGSLADVERGADELIRSMTFD